MAHCPGPTATELWMELHGMAHPASGQLWQPHSNSTCDYRPWELREYVSMYFLGVQQHRVADTQRVLLLSFRVFTQSRHLCLRRARDCRILDRAASVTSWMKLCGCAMRLHFYFACALQCACACACAPRPQRSLQRRPRTRTRLSLRPYNDSCCCSSLCVPSH